MSIDWVSFEEALGATYHRTHGCTGHIHAADGGDALSQLENVVLHWVENPSWQHIGGERYSRHSLPVDPFSMTRWCQRLGEA